MHCFIDPQQYSSFQQQYCPILQLSQIHRMYHLHPHIAVFVPSFCSLIGLTMLPMILVPVLHFSQIYRFWEQLLILAILKLLLLRFSPALFVAYLIWDQLSIFQSHCYCSDADLQLIQYFQPALHQQPIFQLPNCYQQSHWVLCQLGPNSATRTTSKEKAKKHKQISLVFSIFRFYQLIQYLEYLYVLEYNIDIEQFIFYLPYHNTCLSSKQILQMPLQIQEYFVVIFIKLSTIQYLCLYINKIYCGDPFDYIFVCVDQLVWQSILLFYGIEKQESNSIIQYIYKIRQKLLALQTKYTIPQNPAKYKTNQTRKNTKMSTIQPSIVNNYTAKKQQYVRRIRSLPDHVQMKYPDGGLYIGQISPPNTRSGQGIFSYPTGDIYFGSWVQDCFHGQGTYLFASGQIYDGLLNMNMKEGIGTYYYDNCTAYYNGNWFQDLKNGKGVMNSPQDYYEGDWKNGQKHGSGYYKNKVTNQIYLGDFKEGIKNGKGRLVCADGSVYSGDIVADVPHGIGQLEYVNKDKYVGSFNQGVRQGNGEYFYSQGTVFKGNWNNDQKVQGQLVLFNGDIFKGQFKNNSRFRGMYWYKNGDTYEGYWKDDIKQGFGKLILINGQSYEGEFIQGQKHGKGVYKWANGDFYDGYFQIDKRQGLGLYVWADGSIYKGQWRADRMNGYGRLIKDGIDIIGEFYADHFVSQIQQEDLGNLAGFVLG